MRVGRMSAIPLFLPMPSFAGQKTQVESISEKMSNDNTQQPQVSNIIFDRCYDELLFYK